MMRTSERDLARTLQLGVLFLAAGVCCPPAFAQMNYSVRFEMEKPTYLAGEPIFCRFVIANTGSKVFAFRHRTPTRALATDYEQEPHFQVTDAEGRALPDPRPRPCGNPQGSAVYGYVSLPPGHAYAERWLLNQWARFDAPGRYHVHAERHLALFEPDPRTGEFRNKPAGFALAVDELRVQVVRSTPEQLKAAFRPYVAAVENPRTPDPSEAVVVLTSLPQPFFLDQLAAMANVTNRVRWDRRLALDGLARLNTPASWSAILKMLEGAETAAAADKQGPGQAEYPLRSYAVLLLAEKGDPAFIPAYLQALARCGEPLRGDVVRALGFFHDTRAYQALFDNLHSARVTDRMNAILGLKNLGTREVIPALLAALNDPEAQVRAVANFALEGLTGHKVEASDNPSPEESRRIEGNWHAWWREHAASFTPPPPAACHEW